MTTPFFEFERDFSGSLRCIPMVVRHHLDTCGVKLKLEHWNHFNQAERQDLVRRPCDTPANIEAYKECLQALIAERAGSPAKTLEIPALPPWKDLSAIPAAVLDQCQTHQVSLSLPQWSALSELQRFALIKLSRPSHENRNFMPAMQEFGLVAVPQ